MGSQSNGLAIDNLLWREYEFSMATGHGAVGWAAAAHAVARALTGHPGLIIANEPTSVVDANLQAEFFHLPPGRRDDEHVTLILVSEQRPASYFSRTIDLNELCEAVGRIV